MAAVATATVAVALFSAAAAHFASAAAVVVVGAAVAAGLRLHRFATVARVAAVVVAAEQKPLCLYWGHRMWVPTSVLAPHFQFQLQQ